MAGHVRVPARLGPLPPEPCPWPRQQAQLSSAGRRRVGLCLAAGDSAVRSFQRVAGILCNEGRGFLTSYRLQLPSERLLHGEWMITPPKAQPPWYPDLERCCTVEILCYGSRVAGTGRPAMSPYSAEPPGHASGPVARPAEERSGDSQPGKLGLGYLPATLLCRATRQ